MIRHAVGEKFEHTRARWIEETLQALPAGATLLDVGAGECSNQVYAQHLQYTSQDVAQYDGAGDGSGLQTGSFDFSKIDIVCDLLDIPEDKKYDAILFTEVLEHVPDPVATLRKLSMLLNDNGMLIMTAPFCSLVHFAPYFYCSGFSEHFYKKHLTDFGFEIVEITPNGGYFDWVGHEVGRIQRVYRQYHKKRLRLLQKATFWVVRSMIHKLAAADARLRGTNSSELLTNGYFVRATLKLKRDSAH